MTWRELGHKEPGHYEAADLKICELCGALNLADNRECFVCGWHGKFEFRAEVVKLAMELMERKHGKLEAHLLTNTNTAQNLLTLSIRARAILFLRKIRHWFFG